MSDNNDLLAKCSKLLCAKILNAVTTFRDCAETIIDPWLIHKTGKMIDLVLAFVSCEQAQKLHGLHTHWT